MYKTSVKLENYALSLLNLDNLASEFFGIILSQVGGEDTIDIEFEDPQYQKEFERALKNFEKKLDF
jgi:hypothetical protein